MGNTIRNFLLCLGLLIIAFQCASAQPLPSKPNTLVNDYANVLASPNKTALERKLVAYDDSTSTQIAIVIEKYIESDDAFDRSFQIADQWGIGGGENDNGVLIYIAIDNRKIFIQNGYGVEGRLTDAMTRRIIDQVLRPSFRSNQYYLGLDKSTDIMISLLEGSFKSTEDIQEVDAKRVLLIFIIVILVLYFMSRNNHDENDGGYHRRGRYRGPTRSRGGWVFLPSGGGGFGGGGGGFGGGGFGGFGGGGFGGGGAGGSW